MDLLPTGLEIYLDALLPEEEQEIVEWLDSNEWSDKLKRRTQHFGYEYNYKTRQVLKLDDDMPEIISSLVDTDYFNSCIVNEYERNQGISAHKDAPVFGEEIIIFSLLEDTVMDFTCSLESQPFVVPVHLPRRSMIKMSGPARHEWLHSISSKVTYTVNGKKYTKPQDYRRISLTFRRVN